METERLLLFVVEESGCFGLWSHQHARLVLVRDVNLKSQRKHFITRTTVINPTQMASQMFVHTVQGGCIHGSPSICIGNAFLVLSRNKSNRKQIVFTTAERQLAAVITRKDTGRLEKFTYFPQIPAGQPTPTCGIPPVSREKRTSTHTHLFTVGP